LLILPPPVKTIIPQGYRNFAFYTLIFELKYMVLNSGRIRVEFIRRRVADWETKEYKNHGTMKKNGCCSRFP